MISATRFSASALVLAAHHTASGSATRQPARMPFDPAPRREAFLFNLPKNHLVRSDLDLLVLYHALDRGPRGHAVLEGAVVLQFAHGQLAAHAPGVEHEAVGIEHRVAVGKPFAAGQHPVDLLEIAVEGFEPRLLQVRMGRRIGSVALRPTDVRMRRMDAAGKEADEP